LTVTELERTNANLTLTNVTLEIAVLEEEDDVVANRNLPTMTTMGRRPVRARRYNGQNTVSDHVGNVTIGVRGTVVLRGVNLRSNAALTTVKVEADDWKVDP
jgi:hypothetical protein